MLAWGEHNPRKTSFEKGHESIETTRDACPFPSAPLAMSCHFRGIYGTLPHIYAYSAYVNAVDGKHSTLDFGMVGKELLLALGERIRELRLKRGFSQESFADHCGVHRTFMGTVERGESNLSFQNLARIAAALEVPISKVVSGIEARAAQLAGGAKAAKSRPSNSQEKA
jgi:DNA-binding XRE family transcriptional regulator